MARMIFGNKSDLVSLFWFFFVDQYGEKYDDKKVFMSEYFPWQNRAAT